MLPVLWWVICPKFRNDGGSLKKSAMMIWLVPRAATESITVTLPLSQIALAVYVPSIPTQLKAKK
jgi:hypothetical protein